MPSGSKVKTAKAGLKENFAIMREQKQTCLNYAEREQSQDRKSGIKGERRHEKGERREGKESIESIEMLGILDRL